MENLPEGYWDDRMKSTVVKVSDDWIVSVTPMIFNDRVILTSWEQYPHEYTAGFCYDKGPAAVLAAMAWDPNVDHYPAGYKKIACDSRLAPSKPASVGSTEQGPPT